MTSRKQHLEEMRYALAHNLPLADARREIAKMRARTHEAALRHLENAPVISGRELERRRRASTISDRGLGPVDAPWMMRD